MEDLHQMETFFHKKWRNFIKWKRYVTRNGRHPSNDKRYATRNDRHPSSINVAQQKKADIHQVKTGRYKKWLTPIKQ